MDLQRVHLESLEAARPLLEAWHLRDADRALGNLRHIRDAVGDERLDEIGHALGRLLPRCADSDMALNNFERFITTAGGLQQLPILLESRARTLETLLQLFSTSQFFSDLLVSNPDFLEMLRIPLRASPSRTELLEQLQGEVDSAQEDANVLKAFRKFRQKHMLRIGTNDIIRDRPLEEITRDISRVADTALEVALTAALRTIGRRFGMPYTNADEPARCVILAFGKLGGKELNYSSDIDLMFLYDQDGATRGPGVTHTGNDDFFARTAAEVVRLLGTHTDRGQAYRVDLRLRPEGHRGPLARSLASTLAYYDRMGRTWERQALIKVRPVAGDVKLGEEFLKAIEPFVYRKYLSAAEINEIKAIKRRIEYKSGKAGESETDVKTGRGGIRDVEFTIQYLQLHNGGDLPEIRQRGTFKAMQALARHGCLNDPEYRGLDDTYRFLRKAEHRLQLMFDNQTHSLPDREDELRKLALRMGYANAVGEDGVDPLQAFLTDYREKTSLNRTILDHLLHESFRVSAGEVEPEYDLILDPSPDPDLIEAVLGKYGFQDVPSAYHNLLQLATENIPFLSTRRCRQFLANIAPQLLHAIAATPDPDMALVNLEKVSASLGGKAVLWELFSFNHSCLMLYVELCAWSQFLSEILVSNPGMIDELLDSLVLNQPRSAAELQQELADLCRGAADTNPILHSFQDKELLRIGVRDILGKDSILETTTALSELAETILVQIAVQQYPAMVKRLGLPVIEKGPKAGAPSRYVLLALGKLGSREMSYHSDLDLILVYEGDGRTLPPPGSSRWDTFELTDNFHFFSELARRIIRVASDMTPMGRLYHVDMRLRPTGKSGSLVIPLDEFVRYYDHGGAQLWERQALTRARAVFGDTEFADEVMQAVQRGIYFLDWKPALVDEIQEMRGRVEASGSKRDLKRGKGGIVDIEFLVQMYRLKYGRTILALRDPNTSRALDSLETAKLISHEEHDTLRSCYEFLRIVEGRLRVYHNRSLDELPDNLDDLEKLAKRVGLDGTAGGTAVERFLRAMDQHTTQTRRLFNELFDRERAEPQK